MSLPRIVVDNSAILPAFFREENSPQFDAGLVMNRARALVLDIRMRRVNAFVPPSFYREFLNVSTQSLDTPHGRNDAEQIREQWDDLLSLPLIVIPLKEIIHHAGILTFEDACPASDAWYVAAAVHAHAILWISHEQRDKFVSVAKAHTSVRLLSEESPRY